MKSKRILVVGGAGYIGGAVTDILLKNKENFSVYDNLLYENQYLKNVNFIHGDVRDRKKLKKLLQEYSHVVWLAAIVGDGACAINPSFTEEINKNSVKWLSKNFNGRIIFTSTCSVYGVNKEPVSENSPTHPISVYAQTKLAAESYLAGKNALIFRLGTAYGIPDSFSRVRMDLAVNYMTMNAVRDRELTVFGGNQWRPFIHVKDIGKYIVKNLDSKNKGIYNLATENVNISDIAKRIQKITKCRVIKAAAEFEDERDYFADTSKGIGDKVFSRNTKYNIEYGIKEIVELVNSKRIKDLDSEYYSNEQYLLEYLSTYKQVLPKK